jgi:hypothetical protein
VLATDYANANLHGDDPIRHVPKVSGYYARREKERVGEMIGFTGRYTVKAADEKHVCKFVFLREYELICNGCLKHKKVEKMYPTECDECPTGKCSDCPRNLRRKPY